MENIRTHRNVLLQEEHANWFDLDILCWSDCAKPGKWSFIYICARNIKFNSVSTIVDQILDICARNIKFNSVFTIVDQILDICARNIKFNSVSTIFDKILDICARNIKLDSVSTIVDQILELVFLLFISNYNGKK
jgi:hypothetical protein